MGKFIDRKGEVFYHPKYGKMEIIENFNCENCSVKFEDGTIVKNKSYKNIQDNSISNPNANKSSGVGIIGKGEYSSATHPKIHSIWGAMLERCYANTDVRHTTYKDVTVCEEWHNFQNFAKWYDNNYIKGFHLDKDLLSGEIKTYSPETCTFVPQEVNNLFLIKQKRKELPQCIYRYNKTNKFELRITIDKKTHYKGTFNTIREAYDEYIKYKQSRIKEVADKWKDKLDPRVYQIMYNYKIINNY